MGTLPFAFSVHHFINSVGADAGFASIIGLAILILLYFAQARETASLRSHAYEATERIQDLEARLARAEQLERAAPDIIASAPGRAMPAASSGRSAVATGQPAAVPVMAGAPAGVGAPALSAATRLIPTAAPAGATALAPSQPAQAPGAATPAGGTSPSPSGVSAPPSGTPAPATVAGGAIAGGALAGSAAVGPGAAPATNGSSAPAAGSARAVAEGSPPRVRAGQTMPPGRRPLPPPRGQAPDPGRWRRILGIVAGVIAVAVVVVVLLIVTGSSGSSSKSRTRPASTASAGSSRPSTQRAAAVNPATVTVAVLNGTTQTGLAGRIGQSLMAVGYKQGAVQTATDQTHTTTIVAYLPGFQKDALAVAKSLKLKPASVAPVDQAAQQVACPGSAPCTANVIVTLGADLANGQ